MLPIGNVPLYVAKLLHSAPTIRWPRRASLAMSRVRIPTVEAEFLTQAKYDLVSEV